MPAGFERRFLGFVDVLGFRSIVTRMDRQPRLFQTVRNSLKVVSEQAERFGKYRKNFNAARRERRRRGGIVFLSDMFGDIKLQMTAFSDCYIVSDTFPAWHVLAAVQALGSRFLEQGMLTRGGVVVGRAYHRGAVVFGPAVVDAYRLESEVAKYPRILVSDEVREEAWGYHAGACREQLFVRDSDGCWFVNVLSPPLADWDKLPPPDVERDLRSHLRDIRKTLVSLLADAKGDLNHRSKVCWLIGHFNELARAENVDTIDA